MFKACMMAGHLSLANPTLYLLRHGGASDDFLKRRRGIQDLYRRGRWGTDSAVKRYEKSARALQAATRVSPVLRRYAGWVESGLGKRLLGKLGEGCRALPQPWSTCGTAFRPREDQAGER